MNYKTVYAVVRLDDDNIDEYITESVVCAFESADLAEDFRFFCQEEATENDRNFHLRWNEVNAIPRPTVSMAAGDSWDDYTDKLAANQPTWDAYSKACANIHARWDLTIKSFYDTANSSRDLKYEVRPIKLCSSFNLRPT